VTINCCGTLRLDRKMMVKSIGQKMELNQGDIKTKVSCNWTTVVWKDKQNVNLLMNMLFLLAAGNFYDRHRKSLKLTIA
jgi:hypothetical protein